VKTIPPKIDVRVFIDVSAIHQTHVLPLYQRDPFPGGHSYSCFMSGEVNWALFENLKRGKVDHLSDDDARGFFAALNFAFAAIVHKSGSVPSYFLNNVATIEFDGKIVSFSGECSLIVRPSGKNGVNYLQG
jgi:hypothetical protein